MACGSSGAKIEREGEKVQRSFYDALGHRLLDRPATGLKATLDVSRWPAGAYLLQVHTDAGVASRKLLVQ